MQRYRKDDIQPFTFSDLKGTHVVSQAKSEAFILKELNGEVFKKEKITEDNLRTERSYEQKSSFRIDSRVRASRGIEHQEQSDFEKRIQEEVERRLETAHQEAYAKGLAEGCQQGQAQALAAHQEALEQKIAGFEELLLNVRSSADSLLRTHRQEAQEFIKRFSKWILFKEIDSRAYHENLLEKLVHELNAKRNLIVKVGKENFAQMPEVISAVESRLGQLPNIRVEIVPEIRYPGIILESENGLIDGSLESVFRNIDDLFAGIRDHE